MRTCKLGVRTDLSQPAARVPWTEVAAAVVYPPDFLEVKHVKVAFGQKTPPRAFGSCSPGTVPVQGCALRGGSGGPPRGARPRLTKKGEDGDE